MSSEFRSLPSVDAVLSDRRVRRLVDEYSHGAVLGLVRARLDDARGAIADGGSAPGLDELGVRHRGRHGLAVAGVALPGDQRDRRRAAYEPGARAAEQRGR